MGQKPYWSLRKNGRREFGEETSYLESFDIKKSREMEEMLRTGIFFSF
jgi:hypothetical protein